MRTLLLSTSWILIWIIAIVELFLGVMTQKRKKDTLSLLVAALCYGLAVDAYIQAFGTFLHPSVMLQVVSQVRYILHGILVPLLLPIPFYALNWMKKKGAACTVWAITAIIMAAGIAMGLMIKTEPVEFAGILRYASSDATPAFADKLNKMLSIGGVIPLLALGIVGIIRKRPWVFLAGFFMFAFSALAPATGNMDLNFIITLFGELLMVFFLSIEAGLEH